jgi:hypothetical protein
MAWRQTQLDRDYSGYAADALLGLDRKVTTAYRAVALALALVLHHFSPDSAAFTGIRTGSHVLGAFHLYMLYYKPADYLRLRTPIILAQRAWHIASLALLYLHTTYEPYLVNLASSGDAVVYFYLITMLPVASLLNAMIFPLSMKLQVPLALLKCAVDIVLAVPKVNCALTNPSSGMQQHTETVCSWTIDGVHRVGQMVFQLPVTRMCEGDRNTLKVLLVATLYLGAVMPLCLVYWYEQWVRSSFQRRVQPRVMQQDLIQQLESVWPYRLSWLAALTIPCVATTQVLAERVAWSFQAHHCSWQR